MREKSRVKVGKSIKVITGKHRNNNFVVKKVDRKKNIVFLENVSRIVSVMNRKEGKRQTREVFTPVHISNVKPIEE